MLSVDGTAVSTKSIDHTTPVLLTIDETFDIGSDTRTPVDDADYQVPFRFTGSAHLGGDEDYDDDGVPQRTQ